LGGRRVRRGKNRGFEKKNGQIEGAGTKLKGPSENGDPGFGGRRKKNDLEVEREGNNVRGIGVEREL